MLNWNMISAMILPNAGGWAVAIKSGEESKGSTMDWYEGIKKPIWNPPNWVFGCAWTGLYSSMGYASYMVYEECQNGYSVFDPIIPLTLYGSQLFLNWTWVPIFFRYHKIGLAFFHILALDVAATVCTYNFYKINKNTIYFMAPYLCWLTFATCLNYSLWKLNKDKKD